VERKNSQGGRKEKRRSSHPRRRHRKREVSQSTATKFRAREKGDQRGSDESIQSADVPEKRERLCHMRCSRKKKRTKDRRRPVVFNYGGRESKRAGRVADNPKGERKRGSPGPEKKRAGGGPPLCGVQSQQKGKPKKGEGSSALKDKGERGRAISSHHAYRRRKLRKGIYLVNGRRVPLLIFYKKGRKAQKLLKGTTCSFPPVHSGHGGKSMEKKKEGTAGSSESFYDDRPGGRVKKEESYVPVLYPPSYMHRR